MDVRLWPWRPRPKPDELLSSWLARIARGNSGKLHTFCHAVWPGLQIWNRDIDAMAPADLLEGLVRHTGVDRLRAEQTTLRPLEGVLFEHLRVAGPTQWVRPLGIFHRTRLRGGQQWCPDCLAADEEPYYRRRWRLAIASTCPHHGAVLADTCHDCGAPAVPHRGEDPLCHHCKADRRDHPRLLADSQALQLEWRLSEMLCSDPDMHSELEELHPLSYFGLIRQVMTVIGWGQRSQTLRNEIANAWGGDPEPPDARQLELTSALARHRISALTARAMRGWPWLFVAHCADAGVWRSWAFADRRYGRSPFAYADVVVRHLSGPPWREAKSRGVNRRGSAAVGSNSV